ncbi:MAG TPA: CARDB domain-containing protein [Polyangium sp.]|jgi:subtilase family serine protease|nr:CARDB domain-containing protein [Polyangium sp.]
MPSCAGKACGDDGCGATCGSCGAGEICDAGTCVAGPPPPKPDLKPGYFYIDDHAMSPGQKSDIHFSIKNEGIVDTDFSFELVVVLSKNAVFGDADDVEVWSWLYPYLTPPGETAAWTTPVTIPAGIYNGNYNLGMYVDPGNIIDESDESDNGLFDDQVFKIEGNPNADLRPSTVAAQQSDVFPGQMANYTFNVENLGPDPVSSFKIGLYYSTDANVTTSDTLICKHTDSNGLSGLASEAYVVTCPVPNLDGSHWFGVVVDPDLVVKETDETNNAASAVAQVAITPLDVDLQIGAVATGDSTVDTGQQVTFSATVTNGGTKMSPPFNVAFYYSTDATISPLDIKICEAASGQSLPPNQPLVVQKTCTVPLLPTDSYFLGAIVDPANQIPETNEGNNTATAATPVSLTAPHMDLVFDGYYGGATGHPGDMVTHHVLVKNPGTAPVPPFEVSLYYSLDMQLSLDDTLACTVLFESIGPQQTLDYSFQCKIPEVPAGAYYQAVRLDPSNKVPETDETNNSGVSVSYDVIF